VSLPDLSASEDQAEGKEEKAESKTESKGKYTGPYRKPRWDIYTMLLLVALFALILGCVCLYFEMEIYNFEFRGGPSVMIESPTAVALYGCSIAYSSPSVAI